MPRLILASSSPYRRALLQRLRVPFDVASPGVDEAVVKALGLPARETVLRLAREKAAAVTRRHGDAVVIASDQAAAIDGRVLDKPGTAANAAAQLRALRGRTHELLTAVAIAPGDGVAPIEFVDVTRLTMRALSDDEVARYVAADQPLDCAGSYKIEALGVALFERVETDDQTAITGLPLLRLCAELRRLGFALP